MILARKIQRYGWVRDLPDARDHSFDVPAGTVSPPAVDMRPQFPAVYDQGQLGSCTANAVAGAVQFDRLRQGLLPDFVPSRLFIYYNERMIEGTVPYDSGAQLRDGIRAVRRWGAPPEDEWPYVISRFADQPPTQDYSAALGDRALAYSRVGQTIAGMRACLAGGFPFVFGFTVYQSFESADVARTGVVPMPTAGEDVLGGHAVVMVGYDDGEQRFIVRNSWGEGWGMAGYCTMPYAYLTEPNLASDFWVIRLVGD